MGIEFILHGIPGSGTGTLTKKGFFKNIKFVYQLLSNKYRNKWSDKDIIYFVNYLKLMYYIFVTFCPN